MAHSDNINRVTAQKTLGCTEAEAVAAAQALRQLAEDGETAQDIKGHAARHSRELLAVASSASGREEVMRRAVTFAVKA